MTDDELLFYDAQDEFLERMSGEYQDMGDEEQWQTSQMVGKRITVKNASGLTVTVRFTLQNVMGNAQPIIAKTTPMILTTGEIYIPEEYDLHFTKATEVRDWEFDPDLTIVHPALLPLKKKSLDNIPAKVETKSISSHSKFKKQKTESQVIVYNPIEYQYCNCFIWQTYLLDIAGTRLYENIEERDTMLVSRSEDLDKVIAWVQT